MVIETGVIIFVGLLFIFIKLPRAWVLRLLGYPLALDLVVSTSAYVLHWGTFTGVMAAAVAGLMCSGFTAVWPLGHWLYQGRADRPGCFHRGMRVIDAVDTAMS